MFHDKLLFNIFFTVYYETWLYNAEILYNDFIVKLLKIILIWTKEWDMCSLLLNYIVLLFIRLIGLSVETILPPGVCLKSRHAWSFPRFRRRFLSLSHSYLQAGPVRERTGNRSGTCCPRFTVATLVGLKYASVASCCCVVSSKVLPRYLSLTRDRKRVSYFAIKEKNRCFVTCTSSHILFFYRLGSRF